MSQARNDLIQAKNVLFRRRASTTDPAERQVISDAIDQLNDAIDAVDQASLLEAAGMVADAADALERVVASARLGPFDNFLQDIQKSIAALQASVGAMQGSERLPPAPLSPSDATQPAVIEAAQPKIEIAPMPPVAAPPGPAPAPLNSSDFSVLKDEYADFFDRCRLRPEFQGNVDFYVTRLIKNKPSYAQVADGLGMPWVLIGIIHGLECGFNFTEHLHNGDPLNARTIHEPKGRPAEGSPPFTWLESAKDAMVFKRLNQPQEWTLPRILFTLESYNGFGYRPLRIPSPYLWSFSTLYTAGKFVADHKFDAAAVSNQCGAAVMLRTLQERNVL